MDSTTSPKDVKDGLSNTLLVGERPPSSDFWYGWWYAGTGQDFSGSPDMLLGSQEVNDGARFADKCDEGPFGFESGTLQDQCDVFHYWSLHPGGANFAFLNGAVKFLAYGDDVEITSLATTNGGELDAISD